MFKIVPFALLLTTFSANAQHAVAKTDSAKVIVTVVSSKNEPRKGEDVVFIAKKGSKVTTAHTGTDGKATVTIPAGDEYSITIKAFADTSQFGTLKIPALAQGESFKTLAVDITYDPAKTYTLNGLQFDIGKATIRPSSIKQLQELLEYLQWKTDEKVEIAGHTDNTGVDTDNIALSQQRADAVKAWLVKKGITADRIMAKGYGASQPIGDNATEQGRQQNRRTEVRIL